MILKGSGSGSAEFCSPAMNLA
ncbi:hypothetical protein Gorai_004330 [Gossypium raimondii]|uniref:Uncharacterized protein n=1 Tax=Gossypium raimondii TaxID=29730 RepID=A0A7J8QHW6_GOSRA|nr:hypothetical protein [Gossypium raimondii]